MRRDLAALAAPEHDVLVIGGGIHGAAAAWESASRGLTTALVEAVDFGAGSSWNSLKTIHGGLRHLQRADVFGLRESARERRAWLTVAPGLVRALPVLVPTYGHGAHGREVLAAGLLLNDLLTLDRNRGVPSGGRIPGGRRLGAEEVARLLPGIPREGLTGGALWCDAQVDSTERLLLSLLLAAVEAGAAVANHLEVLSVDHAGGRVQGVTAKDAVTGRDVRLRARTVLEAAGPAGRALLAGAGSRRPPVPHLEAANLVLRRRRAEVAVGGRVEDRYLFLVPWRDRSMVGTAYARPGTPRAALREQLLEDARRAFPWAAITDGDVTLVHHGRVPGSGGAAGLWSRSRVVDHARHGGPGGLFSIVGVKFTTARATAEEAVDRAEAWLGRRRTPSRTARVPLAEAHLPEGPLADRARRAAEHEMALTLADAVLRRLDLGTAGRAPADALEEVARAMAPVLGWDAERVRAETAALQSAAP